MDILAEPTVDKPIFYSSKGPQYAHWMEKFVKPRFGCALISRFGLDQGERRDFRQVAAEMGVSVGTSRVFVKEGLTQLRWRFLI